jgi:hypothetical protein
LRRPREALGEPRGSADLRQPDPAACPVGSSGRANRSPSNGSQLVGATGFEPATFRPPAECATSVRGCRPVAFPHSHAVPVGLSCSQFRADWNPEWNPEANENLIPQETSPGVRGSAPFARKQAHRPPSVGSLRDRLHAIAEVRCAPCSSALRPPHHADRGDRAQVLDQHPVDGESALA